MRTIGVFAVACLLSVALPAGAATVTYDLVLTAAPAVRTVTVAPGTTVNVTLTALLQPAGSPPDSDGLAGVNMDVFTDLGVAQPPVTLSTAFSAAFPTFASPGSPNDDDLWQVGGFLPLGGPYTRNLGVGTPLTIGTLALQIPSTEGSYTARASPVGQINVLKAGTATELIQATTAAGPGLTINVSAANADGDYDGVPDATDNCPNDANTDQADNDNDGIGNVCDDTPDGTGGGRAPFAFCGAGMAETGLACAMGLFALQTLGRRRRH